MTITPGELQQQINEFWNVRAAKAGGQPHHAWEDEGQHQAWLDALQPLLPSPPDDVLDVGTGTGFLAMLFAELGHRVTGIDLSEGMLADGRTLAAERFGSRPPLADSRSVRAPDFRIGDALVPPFPPASFDVVTNRNVTWTLLDPRRALKNWFALIRPGGRVVAVHHREMRVGANTSYPAAVRAALPPLPDAATGKLDVTTNDPRFSEGLLILLAETGFENGRIVELAGVDAAEAVIGSDHLNWLAVMANRPQSAG